ncbi:MAG: hypothetical protein K0R98_295 [Rickettsiaceae bacterium]|jgi:hypothetical protein|nr:hypothetical protein [Rickettsiaceae bacterium]
MKKYLIVLLIILQGCTQQYNKFGWAKPNEINLEDPPEGPPEYQQGFKDGCASGYSGYANSFNKMFFTWKQDPTLTTNNVYYQMWKDAYAYCAVIGMMVDEHGMGNWR